MSDNYLIGDPVPLTFTVVDPDGDLVSATTATLTVYLPNATPVAVTLSEDETGVYTADHVATVSGRHIARFVATGPNGGVVETVFDVSPLSAAYVTLADVKSYLGEVSVDDTELANVLAAEQAAQAARRKINPYTPDLREALLRRCARNLAARSVPVVSYTSFDGGATTTRVPAMDAEIARLEGPYPKLVMG